MTASPPRSLELRITAYRDNLLSIADQTEVVAAQIRASAKGYDEPLALEDAVKLYRLVADDLTKVIRGEELPPFGVFGLV